MADLRMPDLNSVVIAGNLTNDPSFGETNDRTPVVNFHIASNRRYKDNRGNVREDVCFVGVVAWDQLARSCRGRLFRGSPVLISGELQSRKWRSEDGHNRTIVEIKARKIQFLEKSKNERSEDEEADTETETIEDKKPAEDMQETDEPEGMDPGDSASKIDKETGDDFGYGDLKL